MEFEKLETKKSKFIFGAFIAVLLCLILGALHFVVNPLLVPGSDSWIFLLKYFLETLFATILVSVVLGTFILWASPKKIKNAEMMVLQPYQINDYHLECRKKTEKWWYDGGSGRYTRDVTLPYLALKCKEEQQNIHVCIHILNPNDKNVCEAYAKYRNSLRYVKDNTTISTVRCDLLATIVAAYFWKKQYTNLRVKIYLKNYFSIFRREFSDNMVLITREDPTKPAIVYQNDSDFYTAYKSDLIQGFNQYNKLSESQEFETNARSLNEITTEEIMGLLISLHLESGIGEKELKEILGFVQAKTTPYYPKRAYD